MIDERKNTVIVVSPLANRTGSSILLLRLLDALKLSSGTKFINIFKVGGGVLEEFKKRGATFIIPSWPCHRGVDGLVAVMRKLISWLNGLREFLLLSCVKRQVRRKAKFILVNTLISADFFRKLAVSEIPTIAYAHELEFVTSVFGCKEDVDYLLRKATVIAVPCQCVDDFLRKEFAADSRKMFRLNYILDIPEVIPKIDVHRLLNISKEKVLIMGCGTLDWRKGLDLFYQTLNSLTKLREEKDFHFLWVGGNHNNSELGAARIDIEKLGLSEQIDFIPEVDSVLGYMAAADVFFLSSREDAYPMVVLEAASQHLPTICFDKSGGIAEFVENDAGIVVPFMDTNAAASAIQALIDDRNKLKELGENAYKKVKSLHSQEYVLGQLEKIMPKMRGE